MKHPPRYTRGEEIANTAIHGVGVLLAIAAPVILTGFAAQQGDAWRIVSCCIYGLTLIMMYSASTLYHGVRPGRAKSILRTIDHAAIFLLIAGTYTPFTLVNLRGPWGWSLFGAVWTLALLGIIFEASVLRRFSRVLVGLYVLMGWAVIVAIKPMLRSVEPGGLVLLLGGGLAYTVGVVFYRWRTLPYHHAIWHVFVLAGSVLHFFAVLFYVVQS